MMVTSLFAVICTYLLSEIYSLEILSTTVETPEINETEEVTKINCLFKNVHKGNVIGACASLGSVCSLEGYKNKSTVRKQLGCECLQNVIQNIDQLIDYSPEADYSLNMSEASRTTVTGLNLQGVLVNGAHTAAGYHGKGLHLDGIDDYLDLGFQGNSCLGNVTLCHNGFTISMWLYPTNLTTTKQWYFGSAKPSKIGLQLVQVDQEFRARLRSRTQTWQGEYGIRNRKWVLITVTWYPEGDLQLFIDGCLYEKALSTTQFHNYQNRNTIIGKSPRGDEQYAAAIIDEFLFWERQLNPEEVMSILFY